MHNLTQIVCVSTEYWYSQSLVHDLPLSGAPVLLHVGPLHHVQVGEGVPDHALLSFEDPVCRYEC